MSLDDLQAQLRGALDQQFAALKTHYENAIAEARQQARTDAEHELQAKLVTARAEWEEQLNAQVAAARAECEQQLNGQVAAARAEWEEQLNGQVAAARAEAERAARAEAERAAAEAEAQLRAEFDQARDQAVASVRRSAELELDSERRRAARDVETERERSKSIMEDARTAIDNERQRAASDLETERERSKSIMEDARTAIDNERQRAASEMEAVRAQLESEIANAKEAAAREAAAAAAAKASAATRAAAAAGSSAASAAMFDRVATAIRTLDLTTTLGASLDALVSTAGAIAGRAALFVIDGDRLKSWKSAGIPDIDVQTVESSITGRDLLARAIQAGQPTVSAPDLPAPPFARLTPEHVSLGVPLMIAGRAVAVLYVDGGAEGASTPAEWQGAVDLLARHASALLALRTAMRTFDVLRGVPEDAAANGNGGEEGARRYAKLLVSEIKLYNEGAVRAGRVQRDLLQRLRAEIDRAQRLYEERVPAAVRARDAYFHQELVQTLAGGDASLLGN